MKRRASTTVSCRSSRRAIQVALLPLLCLTGLRVPDGGACVCNTCSSLFVCANTFVNSTTVSNLGITLFKCQSHTGTQRKPTKCVWPEIRRDSGIPEGEGSSCRMWLSEEKLAWRVSLYLLQHFARKHFHNLSRRTTTCASFSNRDAIVHTTTISER